MNKKEVLRLCDIMLLIVAILVLASSIQMVNMRHTPLGGVHGKFGFLMIAIALGHTIKRIRFLKEY